MIELIVAAILQIATLTTDPSASQTFDTAPAQTPPTTTTVDGNPGGTGTWDDGN